MMTYTDYSEWQVIQILRYGSTITIQTCDSKAEAVRIAAAYNRDYADEMDCTFKAIFAPTEVYMEEW